MPLYFAYGANMDEEAMAERCPRSRPLGHARFMGHRLAVMREGWLTVARAQGERVHGRLWELDLADVAALDRFEDVGRGLYAKIVQPVVAIGGPKRALVYIGSNSGPGQINRDYLARILAAAKAVPLPREGMAALEALASSSRPSLLLPRTRK